MDSGFWHQRWRDNDIGFHREEVNPLLVRYFERLGLSQGDRIFVPLCGKTKDIAWLLGQGYQVAGVELSELAINQLFAELGTIPDKEVGNDFTHYSGSDMDIFVGDYFSLTAQTLGDVAAIYDRAALVALPEDRRRDYARHLITITKNAPLLLITFKYDQQIMAGPPFSVSEHEVLSHFNDHYDLTLLYSKTIDEKLKNICTPTEEVRILQPK